MKFHGAIVLVAALASCSERKEHANGQWPLSERELQTNTQAGPSDPAETTYRRYCIGCHGMDGRGNGGVTGADFTRPDGPLSQRPDAELIAAVREGKRGKTGTMPAHKPVLTDAQIEAVVGFVKKRFAQP